MTLLAEGMSLKDGSSVLAKIASAHSNASMCIEREAHMSVYSLCTRHRAETDVRAAAAAAQYVE